MIVKGSILMCPLSLWHPGEVILNWSSCYSQARNFASSQNYQFCVYRAKNTAVVKIKREARFKVLLLWLSASCRYNDGWSKKKSEPLLLYLLWIVFVAFLQFRTNWENKSPPHSVTCCSHMTIYTEPSCLADILTWFKFYEHATVT